MTDFENALSELKQGKPIARKTWLKKGIWVDLEKSDIAYLQLNFPLGHTYHPEGGNAPWTPTHCDILANDWLVLPQPPKGDL